MSPVCVIGIDIGTTSAKALLLTEDGTVKASAVADYPLDMPLAGWAEQNPEDWIDATIAALRRLLSDGGVAPADIVGLSFSGQMHGLVCLDAAGKVLRPAILWCDTRTSSECRQIEESLGGPAEVLKHTFNSALEGFTLPKLLWVKKHQPEIYRQIHTIVLPKDYVRFRLTGELGMDLSDAAGTLMLDVKRQCWSEAVTRALDIDPSILPRLGSSSDVAGYLTAEMASATGLTAGLLIAFGGADNACAAVGTGVVSQGRIAVSVGTSGTIIAPVHTPLYDPQGRVHTFLHAVPDTWYVMGVMQAAGQSLKWFRDSIINAGESTAESASATYYQLTAGAAQVQPGAEGLLWLPYLNGERTPHLNPNARGVLFGLSSRHTRDHIVRAILEGVAFGLRDSLEIITGLGIDVSTVRITGGGGKSLLWRQIIADVFQKPVATVAIEEGPALGAAIIAGVGVKVFSDFNAAAEQIITQPEVTEPDQGTAAAYEDAYVRYGRLYRAIEDQYVGVT